MTAAREVLRTYAPSDATPPVWMCAKPVALVVAKAPVPGFAKTRLAATVGPTAAAELAADSLLDTLAAAAGTGWPVVVALTGDLDAAPRAGALREALAECTVIDQRGRGRGERLATAHADASTVSGHGATVQIGADTPQVRSGDLVAAYDRLGRCEAVVGPAADGGWWLLAVRHAAIAGCLASVPMSRSDTGARTVRALAAGGWRVGATGRMRDVDTASDADAVAAVVPASRFGRRWATHCGRAVSAHVDPPSTGRLASSGPGRLAPPSGAAVPVVVSP
jgi:glycosyltransferase A (GT-A) superfamily protein (DUF2064 family)